MKITPDPVGETMDAPAMSRSADVVHLCAVPQNTTMRQPRRTCMRVCTDTTGMMPVRTKQRSRQKKGRPNPPTLLPRSMSTAQESRRNGGSAGVVTVCAECGIFYLEPLAHCPTCRRPLYFSMVVSPRIKHSVPALVRILSGAAVSAVVGLLIGAVKKAFALAK